MKTLLTGSRLILPIFMILLTATGAVAEQKVSVDKGRVVIVENGGEKVVTIDTDNLSRLIGDSVDQALGNLDQVLAEMEDLQLEVRLGDDNMISVETEDEAFEVDLDIIFREVGNALETAFEDLDTAGWTGHYHVDGDASSEDLEQKLRELKKELRRLQDELDRAKEL